MYPLSRNSNIDPVTCLVGGVTLAANPQHTVARFTHRVEDTVKEWRCKRTWTVGSEAALSNLPEDLGTLASISVFFTGEVDKVYVRAGKEIESSVIQYQMTQA